MSLSTRTRRLGSQVLTILVAALVAGVFVPRVVAASTSTGDRAIFEPLAPARILDTRDGTGAPAAKVGPGQTIDVPVLGQGGVPADATAVVINLTVTQPSAESHLRVFPTGQPLPVVSSLNFVANQTIANMVTMPIGTGGKVSVFNNSGQTHVIGDVTGYYRGHDHDDRYFTKAQVDAKFAASDYVGSAQIVANAVGSSEIAADAVGTSEIAADAVGTSELAPDAVTGAEVLDGSLRLVDVSASSFTATGDLTGTTVAAGQCVVLFARTGAPLQDGDLLVPTFTAAGSIAPNSVMLVPTVARSIAGVPTARVAACNFGTSAGSFTGSFTVSVRLVR